LLKSVLNDVFDVVSVGMESLAFAFIILFLALFANSDAIVAKLYFMYSAIQFWHAASAED